MPAAVAADLPETTTPLLPAATLGVTGGLVTCGEAPIASKRSEMVDIEMILRIGNGLRCSGGHHCPACDLKAIPTHLFRAESKQNRSIIKFMNKSCKAGIEKSGTKPLPARRRSNKLKLPDRNDSLMQKTFGFRYEWRYSHPFASYSLPAISYRRSEATIYRVTIVSRHHGRN